MGIDDAWGSVAPHCEQKDCGVPVTEERALNGDVLSFPLLNLQQDASGIPGGGINLSSFVIIFLLATD